MTGGTTPIQQFNAHNRKGILGVAMGTDRH